MVITFATPPDLPPAASLAASHWWCSTSWPALLVSHQLGPAPQHSCLGLFAACAEFHMLQELYDRTLATTLTQPLVQALCWSLNVLSIAQWYREQVWLRWGAVAVQSQHGPVVAEAHDNVVVVGTIFMSMLMTKTHSRP